MVGFMSVMETSVIGFRDSRGRNGEFLSLRPSDHNPHIRQAPTACVYSSQSYGAYTCRSHLLKRVIKFRCDEGKKNPRFSLDWYRLKRGFDKRSASEANRLVIQRRAIRPIRNTHRDSLQHANKRNHVRFFTWKHRSNINTKRK